MFYIYDIALPMNEPTVPLAILRRTIGLKQKEMADLLECSLPTIQAIEYGKLKLSDKLHSLAVYKTGISSMWLSNRIGGMNDRQGKPYTRESFERRQALLFAPPTDSSGIEMELTLARSSFLHAVERMAILFTMALREKNVTMCNYKVASATEEVLADTGTYKKLTEDERTSWNWFRIAEKRKEPEGGYGMFSYTHWLAQKLEDRIGGAELIYALDRFMDNTEAIYQEQIKKLKPSQRPKPKPKEKKPRVVPSPNDLYE